MRKPYKEHIDFDDPRLIDAIHKLDISEFLDDCGVNYRYEGKNIGDRFIGIEHCPDCNKGNFHFGIHKEQLFGSCLVCKAYYSPLKMIAKFKKLSIKEAFNYLVENNEYEMDVEERVNQIFKSKKRVEEYYFRGIDDLPDNKEITAKVLARDSRLKTFLKERRVKPWEIVKHDLRIGINAHKNQLIFPIYVGGKIVSYQWRRIDRKQYHVPPSLAHYLLWEDEINKYKICLLVEGILDAIHLRSFTDMFYPKQFSVTTGFTKSVSKNQIKLLVEKQPKRLIVILDADSWFDYNRIKNEIPFDVDYVILPKESDPNSMTFAELNKVFKEQIVCG